MFGEGTYVNFIMVLISRKEKQFYANTTMKNSYENRENGFKFVIYRSELQSDIPSVTLDVTLNGTEMAVLAILKQKPDSS